MRSGEKMRLIIEKEIEAMIIDREDVNKLLNSERFCTYGKSCHYFIDGNTATTSPVLLTHIFKRGLIEDSFCATIVLSELPPVPLKTQRHVADRRTEMKELL